MNISQSFNFTVQSWFAGFLGVSMLSFWKHDWRYFIGYVCAAAARSVYGAIRGGINGFRGKRYDE